MRTKSRAGGSGAGSTERTFVEEARRAQIVRSAIETIAELGAAKASMDQIAKRAGLSSKGLISYHFRGKQDLIEEVLDAVFTDISAFMTERMGRPRTARSALRAYIEGSLEYSASRRTQMKAMLSIFLEYRPAENAEGEGLVARLVRSAPNAPSPLEDILRWGQRSKEFRRFDVRVMAITIQRALEGLPLTGAYDVDVDVERYARELWRTFDIATRRAPAAAARARTASTTRSAS